MADAPADYEPVPGVKTKRKTTKLPNPGAAVVAKGSTVTVNAKGVVVQTGKTFWYCLASPWLPCVFLPLPPTFLSNPCLSKPPCPAIKGWIKPSTCEPTNP